MAYRARPTDKLALVEYWYHVHYVGRLDVPDVRIIVGEDIARSNARVDLVVVFDHPLDEAAHGVDVDHDTHREHDAVAFGRIKSDYALAHLADPGRSRDPFGGLTCRDH